MSEWVSRLWRGSPCERHSNTPEYSGRNKYYPGSDQRAAVVGCVRPGFDPESVVRLVSRDRDGCLLAPVDIPTSLPRPLSM